MMSTKERVEQILLGLSKKKNPIYITMNGISESEPQPGCSITGDTSIKKIENFVEYIKVFYAPRKTINTNVQSYGLKHDCANSIPDIFPDVKDTYSTNGQFIMAMLLAGYQMKWTYKMGLNPRFNVKILNAKPCTVCKTMKYPQSYETKKSARCIECDTTWHRTRVNGWRQVPQHTKNEIKLYIEDGFCLKHIANKFNIPYANMMYWKKIGKLNF